MLYLICYDIASPRRRKKLADVLLDCGDRVQKSAYECDLPPAPMWTPGGTRYGYTGCAPPAGMRPRRSAWTTRAPC